MPRSLSILAATMLLAACASQPVPDAALAAHVDRLMADYQGQVPGASVLVLKDGEPLVRQSYGLADVERGTAAVPATNYRLASITKQFTAAAILLLAEDGRLGIDDPVKRWLPSLPPAADDVTIRHLLSHSSGLIDYEEVMPGSPPEQLRDTDVLRLLESQDRTYFPPGSDYRYSNSAYALLALIVERASGETFQDFLRERIFEPLGMDNTIAYVAGGPPVPNRAYGHSLVDGGWTRTDQSPTSAVLGDGGIYSSIDDLARWDAALYDGRLLSDASRAMAFSPQVAVDDEFGVDAYGFGWRIGDGTLWHSGETIGFRNVIVRWPERRLTVVVLTNRNAPEPHRLALQIAAPLLSR